MKKLLIIYTTLFSSFFAVGQTETIEQTNHHEISFDVSPFLSQFFFGNTSFNMTPYNLMYRYHFETWALRAGIGAFYENTNYQTNDTLDNSDMRLQFQARLGIERKVNFMKHWQFYYGADLQLVKDSWEYYYEYTQTASRREKNEAMYYGIAPLIGFRFKFNERISVTTESSYLFNFYKTSSSIKNTPEANAVYDIKSKSDGFSGRFFWPINVNFTYNF